MALRYFLLVDSPTRASRVQGEREDCPIPHSTMVKSFQSPLPSTRGHLVSRSQPCNAKPRHVQRSEITQSTTNHTHLQTFHFLQSSSSSAKLLTYQHITKRGVSTYKKDLERGLYKKTESSTLTASSDCGNFLVYHIR